MTIRRMQGNDTGALYRLLSDPAVMRYLEPPYDRARKVQKNPVFCKGIQSKLKILLL